MLDGIIDSVDMSLSSEGQRSLACCSSWGRKELDVTQQLNNNFILFVAMVNGIVSLISLSDFSLVVYKNARDFCVLILYTVTLLTSLISFGNFLVISLGFSMYLMSSANSVSFASSFPIWIPFIYFCSLTAMVQTSKNMLSDNSKSGHPCLIPDLRGNVFSFSSLRIVFTMGFSYIAFIMLRWVSSMPVF